MGRAQARHQGIGRMHLGPVAGCAIGQAGGGQVAVMVPLEVADRVRGQQRADLAEQVVADLGSRDIEHQLVACGDQGAPRQLQRPLRMGTEQIAVGVHHLGFDPEAELHAQAVDMRDQLAQALRELARVRPPVAQGGTVVVTAVEPAIVQHEALDADRGSGARQLLDRSGMDIEVETLPGVQMHRARAHAPARPVQARAQRGVEIGGQAVATPGRAAGDPGRGVPGLARFEPAFAGREPFAHLPLVLAVVQPFDELLVVARPCQVPAVDHAGVVAGARGQDDRAREAVVAGAATPVLALPDAAREHLVLLDELVHMLAGVVTHGVTVAGQRQRGRCQPLDIEHGVAEIGQHRGQGQHVGFRLQLDRQVQPQACDIVEQVQHDCLARLAPFDLAALEGLGEIAPLTVCQQRALAEPADAKARTDRQRLVGIKHEAGQRTAVAQRRARPGAVWQARAPVAPKRRLVGSDFNQQRTVAPVQGQVVEAGLQRVLGMGTHDRWRSVRGCGERGEGRRNSGVEGHRVAKWRKEKGNKWTGGQAALRPAPARPCAAWPGPGGRTGAAPAAARSGPAGCPQRDRCGRRP